MKITLNKTIAAMTSLRRGAKLALIALAACATAQADFLTTHEDAKVKARKMRAANFLSHATMGGSVEEIDALADRIDKVGLRDAFEEWIDQQLALPRSGNHLGTVNILRGRYNPAVRIRDQINFWDFAWWNHAINDKDQLRHRMAFALSQIFVVSNHYFSGETNDLAWRAPAVYYDMLMDNAFGKHQAILRAITYNPLMGGYLGVAHNAKANPAAGTFPDENYAREVMQLFSLGLYARDMQGNVIIDSEGFPVENYTNEDIVELAQVFTGFSTVNSLNNKTANFFNPNLVDGRYFTENMKIISKYRDQSPKNFLGKTIDNSNDNTEINQTMGVLANHPSTAPHMSLRLIQRLTSSNPSADYVGRVATVWKQSGGDFSQIIKAIYLDDEVLDNIRNSVFIRFFRNGNARLLVRPADKIGGRLKENTLKWTNFYRMAKPVTTDSNVRKGILTMSPFALSGDRLNGMLPLWAPSVFNFYDWEHSPTAGPIGELSDELNVSIVSPEMEIIMPRLSVEFAAIENITRNFKSPHNNFRYSKDANLVNLKEIVNNTTTAEFLDFLDIYMCSGKLTTQAKNDILEESANWGGATRHSRIMGLVFNSSEFSVSY